jgi:hypothetical protein
LFYSKYVKDR